MQQAPEAMTLKVIAHIHTSWCFLYTVSHPYSFY